jgi:2-polyprenyl-3-methyl-5-hydroxy-6-metoxy-1,4-benzoquinol methylase
VAFALTAGCQDTSRPMTAQPAYYATARDDLVAELPRPLGRVLDVGCGEGATGPALRAAGATWLAGIELHEPAAERAREHYDAVAAGPVEEVLDAVEGPFDTICCYDVLEHLARPEEVLRRLHAAAGPGAHLQVSLPNARHFSLVRDLVVRGTFGSAPSGHRDVTHLRWFTRRDIVAALEAAGWQVVTAGNPGLARRERLHRLTRGRLAEFTVVQWVVLARRGG